MIAVVTMPLQIVYRAVYQAVYQAAYLAVYKRFCAPWMLALLVVLLSGCVQGQFSPIRGNRQASRPPPAAVPPLPQSQPAPRPWPPAQAPSQLPAQTPRQTPPQTPPQTVLDSTAQMPPAGQTAAPAQSPPAPQLQIESPQIESQPPQSPLGADGSLAAKEDRYQSPPPPQKTDVPRVAILLPLSGPHSEIGQALLNAAQLALFHFADKRFELLLQDTRGTSAGAADAAALAIGDGAALILGPLLASSAEAITSATRAAGVTVIAFSNDRRVVGNGVFTVGFLPGEQVDRVVRYAYRRGLRNFALLAPDDDYGSAVAEALNQTATQLSAAVTRREFYDPLSEDLAPVVRSLADYDTRRQNLLGERKALAARNDEVARAALRRLENLQTLGDVSFDALLIAEGGKRLQAIAALLPHFDIDPKKTRILGTGQWDVHGIGREPALLDAWFAAPPPARRAEFITQYQQIYGKVPPRIATLAYDATAIAAVFARGDGKFDLSEILSPQGFTGRDGLFRFLGEGITQRGLSVHQVKRTRNRVIDPAPSGFGPQTN